MEIPESWFNSDDKISKQIMKLVLTSIMKPSRSFDVMREVINEAMGDRFMDTDILNTKDLILN